MYENQMTQDDWEDLVEEYEQTKEQITQKEFAAAEGVALTTFKNRLYRIRRQRQIIQQTSIDDSPEFVELLVPPVPLKQHVNLSIECEGHLQIDCCVILSVDELSSILLDLVYQKC